MHFKNIVSASCILIIRLRGMSCFTQIINPLIGQNEWQERNNNYDYHQEVANAGFGDMLHDGERNKKYFAALRKTIKKMHNAGRKVHVLDIGTGTGILSMMAIEAGADSVLACEAFLPMANCAERILSANGFDNKIKLVKKRSTDLKIGVDMPQKANLLVTEILDTELIGEGAISIYNHAHDELLTDDAICIPARANCYAQVVESPLAAQWNKLKLMVSLDGDVLLNPTDEILQCKGEAAVHDVQLSQLPLKDFRPLTQPVEIFQFDFIHKTARKTKRQRVIRVKSTQAGSTDLVFYWWEIIMDLDGDVMLSCAPFWAHPEFKELSTKQANHLPLSNIVPWRDHWLQAIYYIPKPVRLNHSGTEFLLSCNHDEYSLWFSAYDSREFALAEHNISRYTCCCGLHLTYSRSRIGQLNQNLRNKRYMRILEESIKPTSNVLVLGDGCILGLAAAKLGALKLFCHEANSFSRRFLQSLVKHNKLNNVKIVDKLDQIKDAEFAAVTHVFAEPYFLHSILPWDNFYFGTLLLQLQNKLLPNVQINPRSACIYAVPVEFLDLHKIRMPVDKCEGFDLTLFDQMVETSMDLGQSEVEAQPLWEYPCRALAHPQKIITVDFNNFGMNTKNRGAISLDIDGTCNGIALWVDWNLDNSENSKSMISSGPAEPIIPGKFIKWDMFVRQGVHFIKQPLYNSKHNSNMQWEISFQPRIGSLKFYFQIEHVLNKIDEK